MSKRADDDDDDDDDDNDGDNACEDGNKVRMIVATNKVEQ